MNLAKALKTKNRLVGEIMQLQEVARRENSRRSDSLSKVDVADVFETLMKKRQSLQALRGAIAQATAPISLKLAQLSETKTYMNWLNGLPVREGEEKVSIGGMKGEVLTFQWTAFINRETLDEMIADYQRVINDRQDEIDDFNAQTQVAWGLDGNGLVL
jgi:hypothetical protein